MSTRLAVISHREEEAYSRQRTGPQTDSESSGWPGFFDSSVVLLSCVFCTALIKFSLNKIEKIEIEC